MHEGCGGSGGLVGIGGGEVGAGAGAGAAAGTAAGAEALEADDAGDAGALPGPPPAPADAGEGVLPLAVGAAADVAGPKGALVTDATGTKFPSGPRVGTRRWSPPGARAARPPFES